MKRIERLLTAGLLALIVIVGLAAQLGWFNPAAVAGALFGQATGIDVPALEETAMIRRGAGHYERVCASCHASPDRPDLGDELALTPPPPKLHLRVDGWPPEVLFATVKHGIPNTAMPAWPAQDRDDEVWDMVAFLGVLPSLDARVLSPAGRRRYRVPRATLPLRPTCIACHGADGRGSPDGAFPRLDIQSEPTSSPRCSPSATARAPAASCRARSAASTTTNSPPSPRSTRVTRSPSPAGAPPPIIKTGIPARKIPACGACHGPPSPARPDFPALAGQYEPYLLNQLRLFATGHRGGGPFAALMHEAASEPDPRGHGTSREVVRYLGRIARHGQRGANLGRPIDSGSAPLSTIPRSTPGRVRCRRPRRH